MKTTNIVLFSFFALISFTALADNYSNFGELPSSIYQDQSFSNIETLVAQSRELRKDISNTRNIASFTAEDEYWAHEYEKLMSDTSNKDYLKMASEL